MARDGRSCFTGLVLALAAMLPSACAQNGHRWAGEAPIPASPVNSEPSFADEPALFGERPQAASATTDTVVRRVQDYVDSPRQPQEQQAGTHAFPNVAADNHARVTLPDADPDAMSAMSVKTPARRPHPTVSADSALPVVENISVRPQSAVEPAFSTNNGMANAAISAAQHMPEDQLSRHIQQLERVVREQPNDYPSQLRLRYLYLAQGETDRALSVPQGMDPTRAELLMHTIKSLLAGAAAVQAPQLVSQDTVQAVEDLGEFVRAQAQLRVSRIELCTEVRSYGSFTPIAEPYFTAYQPREVIVYCEIENFSVQPVKQQFEVQLSYRLALFTPSGDLILEDNQNKELRDTCVNRRKDFFFGRRWRLPSGLAPGEYVLKVTVTDKNKEQMTEARRLLTVHPSGIARP